MFMEEKQLFSVPHLFLQLQVDHRGWGHCWRQGSHLPVFFIHHIVRVHFQTVPTSIMVFNPYHMLVGIADGFCGIDEEPEG